MLHYKYIHGGMGFTAKLSESSYVGKALFETARGAVEGDSFSYFNVSGKQGLFLQYTPADKRMANGKPAPYDFAEGFLCGFDEVTTPPAKYLGRFKTEAVTADEDGEHIANEPLPYADSAYPDVTAVSSLSRIVDAILFGQKERQIVVLTRDIRQATQYIKLISELLPPEYIKRLGFSVGCNRIPKNLSVIDKTGEKLTLEARLIFPNIEPGQYNALTNAYYVFDTVGGRDNYDGKQSELSVATDSLDVARDYLVADFQSGIARAFAGDGAVDLKLLERIAVLLQVENAKAVSSVTAELARKVLALEVVNGDNDLNNAAVESVECLLQERGITDADLAAISKWRSGNQEVNTRTQDIYKDYLTANYRKLDDEKKNLIIQTVLADPTGSRFSLLTEDSEGDLPFAKDVFTRITTAIRSSKEEYRIAANAGLFDRMTGYFDYKNWHAARDAEGKEFADFFDCLKSSQSKYNLHVCCALLLGSCYLSAKGSFKQSRVERFKKLTEETFNVKESEYKTNIISAKPSEEQKKKQAECDAKMTNALKFMLAVRRCLINHKNSAPQNSGYAADGGLSSFVIDEFVGKKWINSVVGCLSIEALLAFASSVFTADESYVEMINLLRTRLLNADFVKESVNSSNVDGYEAFWNGLSANEKMGADGVKAYLDKLGNEGKVSENFLQYRMTFVKGFFDTMSDEAQGKIIKDGTSEEAFETDNAAKRLELVEESIQSFGTCAGKVSKGHSPFFSAITVWAAGFTILSILLMLTPAIVMCASLGTFGLAVFIEKLKYYMHPLFILVPVYVFALNVCSYAALKNDKTTQRLKRANIITVLCGILPAVAFAIGYSVLWFLSVQLPFLAV